MQTGNFTIALEDLSLSRIGSLLGLDVGSKRIGVAVSDPGRLIANPSSTIKRESWNRTCHAIKRAIADIGAQAIIVGYPLQLDGTEGTACQAVRAFCRNLYETTEMPIALWDERLTTEAGNKHLIQQADMSRNKRTDIIDSVAASLILQGALDYLNHRN